MKITVEMTAEEFELFREYQKDRDSLERELSADYNRLSGIHKDLCDAVLAGIEETDGGTIYADADPAITAQKAEIKDTAAALRALELAADWYA